jgi:hypothetical protein
VSIVKGVVDVEGWDVHPFPAPLAVWSMMSDCPGLSDTGHVALGHEYVQVSIITWTPGDVDEPIDTEAEELFVIRTAPPS